MKCEMTKCDLLFHILAEIVHSLVFFSLRKVHYLDVGCDEYTHVAASSLWSVAFSIVRDRVSDPCWLRLGDERALRQALLQASRSSVAQLHGSCCSQSFRKRVGPTQSGQLPCTVVSHLQQANHY